MTKKNITIFLFIKIALTLKVLFIGIVGAQNIGDIQAKFCETHPNNNEMNIVTQADKETDICLIFENKSNIDTTLEIDFVDGAITPDGTRSCFASDKPKPNFGQHMLPRQTTIDLPAKGETKQIYNIKFPTGFSGVSHGCVAYNVKNNTQTAGAMTVIFRKAHSIDILVGGIPVDSKIKPKSIGIQGDQASNRISLDIENNGNIDQSINISGNISNIFGYSQDFEILEFALNSKDSIEISSSKLSLPEYKGLFSVKLNISYQPQFNFHITNSNLNNEYTNPGTISISKTLMLWNWFYVVSLSVIILLITIIIFKKTKHNS